MMKLVSPDYVLEKFCHQMIGRGYLAVIEAASAEISYARRNHREIKKEIDFQKGSMGWMYCEDLQRLVSLLMNGRVPSDSSPEFLATVRPLIMHLLKQIEIGDLRRVFSNLPDNRF